jgi:hypothetical protein
MQRSNIIITENNDQTLNFTFAQPGKHQSFSESTRGYRIQRKGTSIFFIRQSDNKLICHFKPFDNTLLICDPSGYALAAQFGTKRFLVGEANSKLAHDLPEGVNAQKFTRDLTLDLANIQRTSSPYKAVNLAELLQIKGKQELYSELAKLFNLCAGFTPGKQHEYLNGGYLQDKYCRFNIEQLAELNGTSTQHIFLLDSNDVIMGTISATIHRDGNNIDIYLYDEIANYFALLTESQIKAIYALNEKLQTARQEEQSALKVELAQMIEPKRTELLAHLFSAVRINMNKQFPSSHIHAFIRAANDRVENYVRLGCNAINTNNYVIHGAPTRYTQALDAHLKNYAAKKLEEKITHSSKLFNRTTLLIGATAVGLFAVGYKLYSNTTDSSKPPQLPKP